MEGYIYSDNKKTKSIKGKTLFDFADTLNIRVPTSCRRNGECHECIVQVSNGRDNLETKDQSEDFLTNDYRLACQAKINICLLYTSPSPRDATLSRMPSSA